MLRYIKLSMLLAALFCFSQPGQAIAAGPEAFSDEQTNIQQAPAKPSSRESASQDDRRGGNDRPSTRPERPGKEGGRPSTRPERPGKEGNSVNNQKPDSQTPKRWPGSVKEFGGPIKLGPNAPKPKRRPGHGHNTRPNREPYYYGYGYYDYDCRNNQDCPANDQGATVIYNDGDVYIQSEPQTYFQGGGRFERFSDPRISGDSFSISLPDSDTSKDDFDRYQMMINAWP